MHQEGCSWGHCNSLDCQVTICILQWGTFMSCKLPSFIHAAMVCFNVQQDVTVTRIWIAWFLDYCTCKWFILLSHFGTMAWPIRRSLDFIQMTVEHEGCVSCWFRFMKSNSKLFLNHQSSWNMSLSIGNLWFFVVFLFVVFHLLLWRSESYLS